jgi:hypothetical protein
MKRITAIAIFAVATLVAAGSAMAQGRAVQANVPFDFTVGNTHVPAGTYTIWAPGSSSLIELRNDSAKVNIFQSAYADGHQPKANKLVFAKYGDQYFLHEILCSTNDLSMQVPTSKAEKRMQSQQASLQSEKNQVYIALNEMR